MPTDGKGNLHFYIFTGWWQQGPRPRSRWQRSWSWSPCQQVFNVSAKSPPPFWIGSGVTC